MLRASAFWGLFCSLSFAASPVITFSGTPVTAGSVKVYPQAQAEYSGKNHALALTGYGIYKRKISVFSEDIYLAQSYLLSATDLQTDPAKSVADNEARVLKLSILRSITAEQISSHI